MKMNTIQRARVVRESRQGDHWKSETGPNENQASSGKKWARFHGAFLSLLCWVFTGHYLLLAGIEAGKRCKCLSALPHL